MLEKIMEFVNNTTSLPLCANLGTNIEMTPAGRGHTPAKRERHKSPVTSFNSSNITTSPSSLADTTFEPTIDMMVNDFDDEATLNEEEALADLEAHNPEDEIATLREESEMPIEELLAKYSGLTNAPMATFATSSSRRLGASRRRQQRQHQQESKDPDDIALRENEQSQVPENGANDSNNDSNMEQNMNTSALKDLASASVNSSVESIDTDIPMILNPDTSKKQRSHLLELYPDESFEEPHIDNIERFTPLQNLFDEMDDEADSDTDSEDTRKVIMIGRDYQAEIPEGLSQYGDILPYENEDQLIWEPSQVSEREVEEYLSKVQETRPIELVEGNSTGPPAVPVDAASNNSESMKINDVVTEPNSLSEAESLIRDNEQALHLLVQCGYDFKEALRRKRLNVLPLNETMDSWSEEECQKFEEGIQKFGKDFVQIRQNQVRTRTMRELVQFYYLWKKSERRDQRFALNDTIDHMDVFINEGGDRAGNGNGSNDDPSYSSGNNSQETAIARKSTLKSFSIMTGSNGSTSNQKRRASFALDEANGGGDDDDDEKSNVAAHEISSI